jgi:hypothetical protein
MPLSSFPKGQAPGQGQFIQVAHPDLPAGERRGVQAAAEFRAIQNVAGPSCIAEMATSEHDALHDAATSGVVGTAEDVLSCVTEMHRTSAKGESGNVLSHDEVEVHQVHRLDQASGDIFFRKKWFSPSSYRGGGGSVHNA